MAVREVRDRYQPALNVPGRRVHGASRAARRRGCAPVDARGADDAAPPGRERGAGARGGRRSDASPAPDRPDGGGRRWPGRSGSGSGTGRWRPSTCRFARRLRTSRGSRAATSRAGRPSDGPAEFQRLADGGRLDDRRPRPPVRDRAGRPVGRRGEVRPGADPDAGGDGAGGRRGPRARSSRSPSSRRWRWRGRPGRSARRSGSGRSSR